MKKILILLILISNYSLAGVPQKTGILPETIFVGDEVQMALAAFFGFCIATEENIDGDRYYYEIDDNNHITVIIVGFIFDPCAGGGAISGFTHFYSLGQLPTGNYTAQMYLVGFTDTFPPQPGQFGSLLGGNINFTVNALPVAVPSSTLYSITLLGLFIVVLAFVKLNMMSLKSSLYLSLLLLSTSLSANKTFHILLSADDGTPTAEQVVSQANTSPSPPAWILSSFNDNPPIGVGFLLQDRPQGNLLNLTNNNPGWSLAKLFRYLVVTYPDSIDENVILSSFDADTAITHAGYTGNIELMTSASYAKMNDNGAIQVDHPALDAFDSSENYLGGNMLDS